MTFSTLELGIKRVRSYISFILLAIRHYQHISESYVLSQDTTSLSAPEVKKFVLSGCYEVT